MFSLPTYLGNHEPPTARRETDQPTNQRTDNQETDMRFKGKFQQLPKMQSYNSTYPTHDTNCVLFNHA